MQVPSPRLGVAVVEELIAGGVRDVVLAPGSRSAPLALAVADAERQGLLRLHVRIDERSAAYLALGIARVSRSPVAVVTTSGTAAVNLHPAIVEAAYSGVPLIAVTADRPAHLRGSGANQTIDQRDLFGVDVRVSADLEGLDEAGVREVIADAMGAALEPAPRPIHLNVPLTEPLVAPGEHVVGAVSRRTRQAGERGGPASRQSRLYRAGASLVSLLPADMSEASLGRGVIVAGDFDDEDARTAAATLSTAMGWPVISEPSGNLSGHPHAVRHGPSVLASPRREELTPDVVVTVGRVGLHRSVTRLLREARTHIAVDVPPLLGRVDGAQTASVIVDAVPVADGPVGSGDSDWLRLWKAADEVAAAAVDDHLDARMDDATELSGPLVASMVARHAGEDDLLVVGPSWPVRHVSMYAGPLRSPCIGNRGTSGIDGVISTGWGAAIAHGDPHPDGTTYVLVGDLTAIYDRNGLIVPGSEPTPRLVDVVADNDGGGIFSGLEQGAVDFARDFERVFGTPHGADVATLLAAPRVRTITVSTTTELASHLAQAYDGVTVIVARCASREAESALIRSIQADIDARLT